MPPSLLPTRALRAFASATSSTARLFTTTTALSIPPRHAAPPASSTTSSSAAPSPPSRIGQIMNDRSPPRGAAAGAGGRTTPSTAAERMLARHRERNLTARQKALADVERTSEMKMAKDLIKHAPRRWKAGDVYAPHDLSSNEMMKWKKKSPRQGDIVDALNLSPLDMYKNFALVRHFTSSSGQINHSKETMLRPVNQRKVAKMIRRVQGMGLYPTIHAHPEMLRNEFFPYHRY